MKKLFILALAFGLASCSTDDTKGIGDKGRNEAGFLTINLATTAGGTRADNSYTDDYEDGTESETKVNKVRFYFFNASNDGFDVDNGKSYKDWTPGSDIFADGTVSDTDKPNIEHVLRATVILEYKNITSGDPTLPKKLIAVLNPDNADLGDLGDKPSLSAVEGAIKNLSTTNGFVMSNSVYLNAAGQKVSAVENIDAYVAPTAQAALGNPVTVYVERVLAKVRVQVNEDSANVKTKSLSGETIYETGYDNELEDADDTDAKIYVRFLGWNVTSTADKSYLVKQIDANWDNTNTTSNLFKTSNQPWNYSTYFRSFWGINPTGLTYGFYKFADVEEDNELSEEQTTATVAAYLKVGGGADAEVAYPQENAAQSGTTAWTKQPTQVIIAAQLCDVNGDPLEMAEYAGVQMKVEDLKAAYLGYANHIFVKEEQPAAGTSSKFRSLTEDEIEIKTAMAIDPTLGSVEEKGRYYVYVQLTEEAAESLTFTEMDSEDAEEIEADEVNAKLKGLGGAKVWTNGYTYYYFDIRHLAESTEQEGLEQIPGYYGVVRNHLYDATVTKIAGLGTPVFDPTETIYPERPDNTREMYLAAEIKILSWRIVGHDYELNW